VDNFQHGFFQVTGSTRLFKLVKERVNDMPFYSSRARKKKVCEALMKRAKFTFFFGVSLFGASLS
jgi:hypothetical protein